MGDIDIIQCHNHNFHSRHMQNRLLSNGNPSVMLSHDSSPYTGEPRIWTLLMPLFFTGEPKVVDITLTVLLFTHSKLKKQI